MGILTWDSDLYVTLGSAVILPDTIVETNGRLRARVVSPDKLAAGLGLPVDCLMDVAVMCGNDYTAPFLTVRYRPRSPQPCNLHWS